MSGFEFVFTLFGLMLGLSIVEILGGLARTIEVRLRPAADKGAAPIRIGWLTPLLGVFVLLDLLSFWSAAWVVRDLVAVSNLTLLATAAFAGSYYLAAYLVFPREPERLADLDTHYFRVRRIVLSAMLALLAAQLAFYASQPALAPLLARPDSLAVTMLLAVLIIGAMIAPGRRANAVLLVALVARYVAIYVL